MRFINKKIIISTLMVIEICSLFLMYKSFNNKNTILDDVLVKENEVKKKTFAIMINDGSGNYIESSSNTFPTNMIYNKELSGCIDIRGNKLENALSFENNMATLNTNTTAYCYLYFDKNNNVYNKLVDDYTNNNGVSLLSETSSDTYPGYYYTGDVTNNNIIYADKCWKMVRTTDTGGVKLIYNGVVTDGSCNNSGTATTIDLTYTAFNSSYNSPAYVGYMYNKVYTYSRKDLSSDTTEYVYGNSVTWNGSNYTLVDTISGTWSSKYSSLSNNHYTCFSTGTTCTSVYYIHYAHSSGANYLTLTGGVNISDALNEMLYAEDVNTTNSTIKTKIDSWYESNIKDLTDNNGKLYSSYLENTIYCNNRAMSNQSTNGFNPDGGSLSTRMFFKYNSLTCENKTDQFTLKTSAGGTAGYGNNALDYPVGLLTYKEASLARNGSSTNYLKNSSYYWLLSPDYFDGYARGWHVESSGLYNYYVFSTAGVRPAVSLSAMVMIKEGVGDGTADSPYEVILAK